MTSSYGTKKYNSIQVAISVLLIGDDDVVIKTSRLLWDTLPRFGRIRVLKIVPLSAVPFVDPNAFQLLFFHLSNPNALAELEALCELREKICKHSGNAVCVLVVPEAGSDVPDNSADFVLTQPVTVETVENVLRRCSFLSEQSQNDSASTPASSSTVVGHNPGPEASLHQAEAPATPVRESATHGRHYIRHSKTWRRSPSGGVASPDSPLLEGPSAELTRGDLQAFLHSQKEQRRRMQIRQCCLRLHGLMPFKCRMDTASILELTVKYVTYVRQRLPHHILDKVVRSLKENGSETWYKPAKAAKKRPCTARNKATDVQKPAPTFASFADDFIAAHVLGRHIEPKGEEIQPRDTLHPAVAMSQPFDPPPGPSVALRQASAPFAQTFVMNQAYGEPGAMDPAYASPLFWKHAGGPASSMMVNQNLVPLMVHNRPTAQTMIREGSSLPPAQTLMAGPEFLPPVGLDPGYPPPAQPVMMKQTFTPLGSLNDPYLSEVTTSLPPVSVAMGMPGVVSDCRPNAATGLWEDRLLGEILYSSAPSLPTLSSSHSTIRAANQPQSSTTKPLFSSFLPGPPQWEFDFGSESVYPPQPYLLESLPPPSLTRETPAQNNPAPGSLHRFLGEMCSSKRYRQHYMRPADYH